MARKKKSFVFKGTEYPEIFEEIVKKNGKVDHIRYYFKNDKGNKVRAKEKEDIVAKLAEFKIGKNEETLPLYVASDLKPEQAEYLEELGIKTNGPVKVEKEPRVVRDGRTIRIDAKHNPPKKWVLRQFREMLEKDKHKLADEMGIPEIAYLPKLKPQTRYTLRRIGNFYFEREKHTGKLPLTEKILNESKQYWREFQKITGVKYVDELDKTIINKYNAELREIANNPKHRPAWLSPWQKKRIKDKKLTIKWIKTRLNTIKTILANAVYVVENSLDIEAALILCRKNFYHEDEGPTIVKHIFEKEHIETILEILNNPRNDKQKTAYVKWKAVILLALNCAFTPVDFMDLTFKDIDLKKKELSMIRKKKNTERYAVLWGRTVSALNDYLETRPVAQEEFKNHVFINKQGTILKADNLGDDFRGFLKKVNKLKENAIPEELTFRFFRKSAASSAERTKGANPSEVEYLMGHSIGIRKHYTHRAADLVGNVCKKIENDYFG